MSKITKPHLADALANAYGLPARTASLAVTTLFDTIQQAVAAGHTVTIPGFGTFEPAHHAARQGRNPQTGEPIQIPARTLPKFKPGKTFKDAVAKGGAE